MTASVDAAASASAGAPARRAPDFFIVGHPKSGTSALFQMLQRHPQLHMPRKEPHYFVPEVRSERDMRFSNGIGDYLELFAGARPDQLIGEATTAYLWSQHAAARIAEVQPDARIIAVLREPADFLRSLHMQFIRSNVEVERDLRKAIALDEERRAGRQIPRNSTRPMLLVYADHVRYMDQLRRYHEAFGRERVLVLIYEDFRADNAATLRTVLSFLGVDGSVPLETIEANPTVAVRSPRLYTAIRSLYLGRDRGADALKRSIKTVTSQRMRRQVMWRMRGLQYEAPPPADEPLMRELRARFKPEVVALSEYLGRDLVSFWGYDEL